MRYVLLLVAVLMTGCRLLPDEAQQKMVESPYESIFHMEGDFPDPESYGDIENDTEARNRYIDTVNWYLIKVFAQTQIINDYGLEKGWVPMSTPPICKLASWPDEIPFPVFDGSYKGNDEKFLWELTNFIRSVKEQYNKVVDDYEEARLDQIEDCVY